MQHFRRTEWVGRNQGERAEARGSIDECKARSQPLRQLHPQLLAFGELPDHELQGSGKDQTQTTKDGAAENAKANTAGGQQHHRRQEQDGAERKNYDVGQRSPPAERDDELANRFRAEADTERVAKRMRDQEKCKNRRNCSDLGGARHGFREQLNRENGRYASVSLVVLSLIRVAFWQWQDAAATLNSRQKCEATSSRFLMLGRSYRPL